MDCPQLTSPQRYGACEGRLKSMQSKERQPDISHVTTNDFQPLSLVPIKVSQHEPTATFIMDLKVYCVLPNTPTEPIKALTLPAR